MIVAIDEYEHEGLRNLLAPAADAAALEGVLGDEQIGNFDVQIVRNELSHVVQAQIDDFFSDSRPDDVLVMHFSCHGLKSESGELFFAARNTRPNRLGSTAISADFVQRCMRASRSRRIVLLLDCCYGGAFGEGVTVRASGDVNVLDSFPGGELGGGRGRAVITASSSMEYAFEGDRLADNRTRPSVFTTALVEGLATGEADRDEDGWVSLNELYEYVFDRVQERNPHQTPNRKIDMQGELYLARSRRRRIRPLPIPPGLEEARTDPDMYRRLGAVGELRSWLNSDNLPKAAGAYEALADTARTDIRYVAEPAEAALREAAVHPAVTKLDFGRIGQGSAPPHHTVPLLGSPIARAGTPHASHDWIRVNKTTEGLDISIDTAQAGTLHGSIDVKGPTGEAAITIDVDLIPSGSKIPGPTPRRTLVIDLDQLQQIVGETLTLARRHLRRILLPRTHRSRAVLAGVVVVLLAIAVTLSLTTRTPTVPARPAGYYNDFAVAFSPDGKTLASAGGDGPVRLWNVVTREQIGQPLTGHTDNVSSVAFSPDGKILASASWDQTVRLWNPATGHSRGTI